MDATRPLRDVFTALTGEGGASGSDPGEALRLNGHADLSDGLVAEAVVSYADTAPIEVAEHLAPFVMANSPVPIAGADLDTAEGESPSWLDALATAPVPADIDPADIDPADRLDHADPGWAKPAGSLDSSAHATSEDLAFGHGDPGTGTGAPAWEDPSTLDDATTADQAAAAPSEYELPAAFDEPEPTDLREASTEATVAEDGDHLDDVDDA